jgi:peptidoglycan/xylan/chitin deacetylase (PgdA/CDA1 family)
LKALLKTALCAAYKYSGTLRCHEALVNLRGNSRAVIVLLHRVTDDIPEDGLTVGVARFRRLCAMLRRRFHVVPLGEVFRLARAGAALPRRRVAITFDDCYGDNLAAARILAEHGLPATFFLPTAYVGTDQVFSWDRHLPPLPNLTWDEVGQIVRLGFEVGSHTLTHPNLAALPAAEARHEIVESKRVLEERTGRPVRWFAYPFGGREHFRDELLPLVAEAGYEGCLSGDHGHVGRGMSGLMLPREPLPSSALRDLLHLELFLTGCLDGFYRLRRQLSAYGNGAGPHAGNSGRIAGKPAGC